MHQINMIPCFQLSREGSTSKHGWIAEDKYREDLEKQNLQANRSENHHPTGDQRRMLSDDNRWCQQKLNDSRILQY